MDKQKILARYQALESDLDTLIGPIRFSRDINLKLERITHLLELLGNPHRAFPSIHVGGTSGKGSTATIISSVLSAAGYKTGLHLSPHLQVLNERYQINNELVSTSQLAKVFETVKPAIDKVADDNPFGRPSYFEVLVALAFCLFQQENVDVAVVEVGLGGTLDATNVLHSQVAVLTNVGLDHTDILGDTVELIAQDKTGIIKPGQTVISGFTQSSTKRIVADRCLTQGATLWQMGEVFTYELRKDDGTFIVNFPERTYDDLHLEMCGDFQITNAACAIAAVHAFSRQVPISAVRKGVKQAAIPGRMEVVQRNPIVILDGAHNPDKIEAALRVINENYVGKQRIVVFSLKSGKAYQDILPFIVEYVTTLIVTTFQTKLWDSYDPDVLAQEARRLAPGISVHVERNPIRAVRQAIQMANEDDLIWVTGSLYLVGNVRNYWYPIEDILLQAKQKK